MLERIAQFLEDQHPLVRGNIKTSASTVIGVIALYLMVFIGLQLTDPRQVLELDLIMRLLQTLLLLLLLMMGLNTLKILYGLLRGQGVFTVLGLILSASAMAVVGFGSLSLPNVFEQSIAHVSARPYNAVYQDFNALCDQWRQDFQDETPIPTRFEAEHLGQLADEAEAFRLRDTIYLNFGDSSQREFGLACLLSGDSPPETGRARNYNYRSIGQARYRFIEDQR